ncbi:STAM-binding protein-like A [Corticium candelabrum]|uniref:STAM-binding protein-like A n=1 Tax=Corticium candelabrum TaxID=121492 RepID=UPI002E257F8B|nr:STAM-binding protein-like A [Corticium candelabrum]
MTRKTWRIINLKLTEPKESCLQTHPSHGCFLSSVDLRCHYSYQRLMKESIAIVCAPERTGYFTMTRRGKDCIIRCKLPAHQLHQHPEREMCRLFTDANT